MTMSFAANKSVSIGGKNFAEKQTIEAAGGLIVEQSIGAAKTGVLTTRTDGDTGSLTLEVSHGVTTGQELHLFWLDAGMQKRAVCPAVGTVAAQVVPIDNCTGDVLPTAATAVTVMVPTQVDFLVDGDDLAGIAMFSESSSGTIIMEDDLVRHFDREEQVYVWFDGDGDANPVAGDSITFVKFSHGDVEANVMRIGVVYN